MKKAIRILSFISVAIMTLSCIALLACILLQDSLCQMFFGISGQIIAENPAIPVGALVYGLGNLAAAVVLFFYADKQNTGLLPEIACAVTTGIVLPFLQGLLNNVQTSLAASLHSSDAVIALSSVNSLCDLALSYVGIAVSVMLVICGLSIAIKYSQMNTEGALH